MTASELFRPRTTIDLTKRPRRLRAIAAMRELVREREVRVASLVQPLFIADDGQPRGEISSMPGVFRYNVHDAVAECKRAVATRHCARSCSSAFRISKTRSHRRRTIRTASCSARSRAIKNAIPELLVIADLCNCEYTDHGHCGILDERGDVDNDATLELLAKTALSYARGGRRHRRAVGHDGRPRRPICARRSTQRASRVCRSCRTR